MTNFALRTAVVLGWLILGTTALAQQHANNERGLNAESTQTGTLDNVNLYNGNLALTIPIGQGYNGGGSFSYGLTLVYNSNCWDFKSVRDRLDEHEELQAHPNAKTNAGMGWHVSLGALYAPNTPIFNPNAGNWIYVAPDGSEHRFYDRLHGGDPVVSGVMYTRDNSYLRLNVGQRKVEFPDGQVHLFRTDGLVSFISDRFGIFLEVTVGSGVWTLKDSFGRLNYVHFNSAGQVDRVELAAFGGSTATYQFLYEQNVSIARHWKDFYHWEANGGSPQATVSLLKQLVLPGNAGTYQFDYYRSNDFALGEVSGLIKSATLPTLGRYRWEYAVFNLSGSGSVSKPPLPATGFGISLSASDGVRLKEIQDQNGLSIGSWRYKQQQTITPGPIGSGTFTSFAITTVSSPEGDDTVNYFNTTPARWDYSLPYTPFTTNPQDGALSLSQEIYDGPVSNGVKKRSVYVKYDSDVMVNNLTLESFREYNRRLARVRTVFHDDSDYYQETSSTNFDGLGHYRQVTSSGNFPGPAGNLTRTTITNFNPSAGQYQFDVETTEPMEDNNFTLPPVTSAWVLNTYADVTVMENGQTATTQFCFAKSSGFLQGKRVKNNLDATGNTDVMVRYTADSKGALIAEEYFGGDLGGVGAGDLCTVLTNTNSANQYRINYAYDAATGMLKSKTYMAANGVTPVLTTFDRDIDTNTGLTKTERDAAKIATTYEYDAVGRLLWSKPQAENTISNGAWTQISYTPTSQTTKQWPSGVVIGEPLTSTTVTLDPFGRPATESRTMPGGIISNRHTKYNAMGQTLSISEWMQGTPGKKTSYANYDPFGRVGTLSMADGHTVTISYVGVRSITRRVSVGTRRVSVVLSEDPVNPEEEFGPEADAEAVAPDDDAAIPANEDVVATTETFDQQGRLWKLIEDSEAQPANKITTEYLYDIGNRLGVVTISPPSGSGQSRFYDYDNRGFLRSETQPESGVTQYDTYDAMGNANHKKGGSSTELLYDLLVSYDRAGRITKVNQKNDGSGSVRLLKEFIYGSGVTAGNRSNGKVVKAIRHNWHPRFGLDVVVTETYTYGGKAGMTSQRDTLLSTGQSFTQTFAYDDLGNLANLSYPRCLLASCPPSGAQTRQVTYSYTNGYLTSIPGYVTSLTYHPNGLLKRMVYPTTNTVSWNQENDPNSLVRPRRIFSSNVTTAAGAVANFDTGKYQYDGAGNIVGIGQDYYLYDRYGRNVDGKTSSWRQQNTFDAFGNISKIITTNPAGVDTTRVIGIDKATNRLSGVNYDGVGNQTRNAGYNLGYDNFNMQKSLQLPTAVPNNYTVDWVYVYTASDERLWSYNLKANKSYWRLRDLKGNVLREFIETPAQAVAGSENPDALASDDPAVYFPDAAASTTVFALSKDYIYSGRKLVASITPAATTFFLLDHLGSPRLMVNASGQVLERHDYLPFGKEATVATDFSEPMKFTGHERDANQPGIEDDFDYMHARYFNSNLGRFMTTDPGPSADQRHSQSWNRYAYVQNNPINRIDPDGRVSTFYLGWEAGSCYAIDFSVNMSRQTALPSSQATAVQGFVGPPKPVWLNADVKAAIKGMWTNTMGGDKGKEAGFVLNGTPYYDQGTLKGYTIEKFPYNFESHKLTMKITPGRSFATFHVHPRDADGSKGFPSTPENNWENNGYGDTGLADKYQIPFYVLSMYGLAVYDPTTRESMQVAAGLKWFRN